MEIWNHLRDREKERSPIPWFTPQMSATVLSGANARADRPCRSPVGVAGTQPSEPSPWPSRSTSGTWTQALLTPLMSALPGPVVSTSACACCLPFDEISPPTPEQQDGKAAPTRPSPGLRVSVMDSILRDSQDLARSGQSQAIANLLMEPKPPRP